MVLIFCYHTKEVYNPKAFILHAASLRQTFVHCARFPIAASRRSMGRVSVPFWLVILSDQLPVVGLVSLYLTNYLIGYKPLLKRVSPLIRRSHNELPHLSMSYALLEGKYLYITQPSATTNFQFQKCIATLNPLKIYRSTCIP
jgi:hypothetical protein